MSLRLRLTLLYTSLLGGTLLVFGALVYGLVSLVLLDQIDHSLTSTAQFYVSRLQVTDANQFDPRSIEAIPLENNTIIQVWGNDRRLQLSRPFGYQEPLDETGRRAGVNIFRDSQSRGQPFRVLSVPLNTARGPAGVLQVGSNQSLLVTIQRALASILLAMALLAMLLAWVVAWWTTGRAIAPLATVTAVAAQITRADDLSRRIPYPDTRNDEIGQLIHAFNQTLERLESLFTTQRRFLTDVSHELRTPLTVIKGNVGLIRKIGPDEESLASIEDEVDRLTRLVGNLLLLAQAESGRMPLNMAPVALDSLLLEVYQQMRVLAGEKLTLRISEIDQVEVIGDSDRLKQVLLNLVSNAVHYTPAGGQVTLSLCRANDRAQVVISDTGPGIPPQDLPHIFERFYRGERSRKRSQGSGFGLGLSIAYWIVRNHQGSIEVQSREGKGATFVVWLPLTPPEVPPIPPTRLGD